ncbi:MAG TPA: hypothetical protein VNM40_04415 [Candidatus Paceibacterota bacterium]|nr:hypothetical protein [Candidatus Paceibacterota bacterium]
MFSLHSFYTPVLILHITAIERVRENITHVVETIYWQTVAPFVAKVSLAQKPRHVDLAS